MITNLLKKIQGLYEHKVVVLMYHRIANLQTDPWELAVKPEYFEQQLQVLKEKYNLISVDQLITQLKNRNISTNSVCITFDDAYSDNYFVAKPLLEKYCCPATFYIPTDYIGQNQPFWWDELESILLTSQKLPDTLSIQLGKELCIYQVENKVLSSEQLQKRYHWKYPGTPPDHRCKLYLEIWGKLKCLPYSNIQSSMNHIRKWATIPEIAYEAQLPMTSQHLHEIINNSLFQVGIHTATHPALSNHSYYIQEKEISKSKLALQRKSNKVINTIAYPYGDYNQTTLSIMNEHAFFSAFTTRAQAVTKKSDIYQLGRFQVGNWHKNAFDQQLSYWFKNS